MSKRSGWKRWKDDLDSDLKGRCISATIDRVNGYSYQNAITTNELTPSKFFWFLYKKLDSETRDEVGDWKTSETLDEIMTSREEYAKTGKEGLFNQLLKMDDTFLRERYDSLMGRNCRTEKKFADGTYFNKENVQFLVYYALTSDNLNLASHNRQEIIDGINALPRNLSGYFKSLKLGGLMKNALPKETAGSPLGILQLFDEYYQRVSGDKSLFDLEQPTHLHPWGDKFQAPQRYLQGELGEKAIIHSIEEKYPGLKSNSREEVISTINSMGTSLKKIIDETRIKSATRKIQNSRIGLIRKIDENYQTRTGDKSLFDPEQPTHLHEWMDEFKAQEGYWKDQNNIYRAITHTFSEKNPKLLSKDRKTVLEGMSELPSGLIKYFFSLGFRGFMKQEYIGGCNSTVAVLKWFDKNIYQPATNDRSLFDNAESNYAYFGPRNMLMIKI